MNKSYNFFQLLNKIKININNLERDIELYKIREVFKYQIKSLPPFISKKQNSISIKYINEIYSNKLSDFYLFRKIIKTIRNKLYAKLYKGIIKEKNLNQNIQINGYFFKFKRVEAISFEIHNFAKNEEEKLLNILKTKYNFLPNDKILKFNIKIKKTFSQINSFLIINDEKLALQILNDEEISNIINEINKKAFIIFLENNLNDVKKILNKEKGLIAYSYYCNKIKYMNWSLLIDGHIKIRSFIKTQVNYFDDFKYHYYSLFLNYYEFLTKNIDKNRENEYRLKNMQDILEKEINKFIKFCKEKKEKNLFEKIKSLFTHS